MTNKMLTRRSGAVSWNRWGRGARLIAVVLSCALALVLIGFSSLARADVNTDIKVGDLALTNIDASENEVSGQLISGTSLALLTFSWDATNTTVKAGDSFSIDLPSNFHYKTRATKPFTYDFGAGDVEIGQCVITTSSMVCTFNEAMEQAVTAGYGNIKGTGKVQLSTVAPTTNETVEFTINGTETVEVDLPGEGGIRSAPTATYTPYTLTKGASGIDEYSTSVYWNINFGTEVLATETGNTYDGTTIQTITLTDTLGVGMSCPTAEQINTASVWHGRSESNPTGSGLLDYGSEGATTTSSGTFELGIECGQTTASGTPITITITGPFAEKTNYTVYYRVSVDSASGKATAGFVYTNTVSIDGTALSTTGTKSFVDSFGLTVTMEAGYGTFRVAKYITGSGATQVAAGTSFPVTVSYALPTGTTAADYPSWTPPGTLSSDNRTGTATLNAILGQLTVFTEASFPAGTTITLSEDLSDVALPAGYSWGSPVFSTGTLTIADQTTTPVTLTNTVNVDPNYFQVVKNTSGNSDATGKEYTFSYTCSDGSTGTITATGDGTAALSDQTFAVGTTCTVSEDADSAAIDGYTLDDSAAQAQTVTIGTTAETMATAEFTNAYTQNTGTFAVAKSVTGDYQATSADSFDVTYTCDDASNTTGTLALPADGTAVAGPTVPIGTTCTVEENMNSAARDGYALATSYSQGSVTVSSTSDVPEVTITNNYTTLAGSFTVSKTVDGDGAELAADKEFTFSYTCTPASGADELTGTVSVAGGQTAVVDDIPVGECTVTEQDASVEGASLDTTITVDESAEAAVDGVATLNVSDSATVQIAATNTYTRERGAFSMSKTVVGGEDSFSSDSFTFNYTCTDGSSGSLSVPGDGTEVTSPTVPAGESCTITEDDDTANREGYTVVTDISDAGQVTIAADEVVSLTATNTYTTVPEESPSPSASASASASPSASAIESASTAASPSAGESPAASASASASAAGGLASTGAGMVPLYVLAALSMTVCGAYLLLLSRRRNSL